MDNNMVHKLTSESIPKDKTGERGEWDITDLSALSRLVRTFVREKSLHLIDLWGMNPRGAT